MTNHQLAIRTLDLICDAANIARQPLKVLRNDILEYALNLAASGAPIQVFKILKVKADSYEKCADDLKDVADNAWVNASKLYRDNSHIA